ncbi:MAG: hypothetical protein CM1200mP6_05690 [Anaerolineaceae bacterium]|nr:MAG: hypothetical protein CM1200mP6_05690 [Anaerolineaceae bacterium]
MDLKLQDKVVLVTGGSKGIGKAISLSLSKEGCKVAICARGEDLLKKTASLIQNETGNEVLPVTADLTQPTDVKLMTENVVSHFGRIDVLVNNAGSSPGGILETLTEEDWGAIAPAQIYGICTLLQRNHTPYAKARWWQSSQHYRKRWGQIFLLGNHARWVPTRQGRTSPYH